MVAPCLVFNNRLERICLPCKFACLSILCHPRSVPLGDGVTRGGPPPRPPLDATDVTPMGGSAECLISSIVEYLSENHISAEKLLAVGCDGTDANTGRVGGVITLLEQELRKPLGLQWLICMLHVNKFPPSYCRVLMEQHLVRVHFPVRLVNACQHVNSCLYRGEILVTDI